MDYFLAALVALNLTLTIVALHKIRRIHLATYHLESEEQKKECSYAQFQAYDGLMRLIRPERPLPILRGWAASPDFLLEIAKAALREKPEVIIECSSGASSVVLARCCQLNGSGHVYSIEHDANYASKTRNELQEQGLADFATLIIAPLNPSSLGQNWYDVTNLPDACNNARLLVIDGPPASTARLARYPALPLLLDRLAVGCKIYLDDANRESEKETVAKWKSEFANLKESEIFAEKGAALLEVT